MFIQNCNNTARIQTSQLATDTSLVCKIFSLTSLYTQQGIFANRQFVMECHRSLCNNVQPLRPLLWHGRTMELPIKLPFHELCNHSNRIHETQNLALLTKNITIMPNLNCPDCCTDYCNLTEIYFFIHSQIARFLWSTWDPPGADRTQVGPMLAPWTLLSGLCANLKQACILATKIWWHQFKYTDPR